MSNSIDMGIKEFFDKFNPLFLKALKQRLDGAKNYTSEDILRKAIDHTYTLFSSGGKRVRPYVLYLMYKSAGGKDDVVAFDAGIALEFLHAFALVHDDVMDHGEERHDVATVNAYIGQLLGRGKPFYDASHLGNSQAILIGDLLLAFAYDQMRGIRDASEQVILRAQEQLTTTVVEVAVGQMLDIHIPTQTTISNKTIRRRDSLKTASYSFINPMLIGAILAGQDKTYGKFCRDFGNALGIAFQMHDELADVEGGTAKDRYADIREFQHTHLTQYVLENGSEEEKKTLEEYFKRVGDVEENKQKVIGILSSESVLGSARKWVKEQYLEAREILENTDLPNEHKEYWRTLISYLEDR